MAEQADKCELDPSGYIEHQIPHIRQQHSWDCGVTCVMMVLGRAQREDLRARLPEIAREEGFGQSTWTIDLCYLLKRYGIEHCMYTTMAGVNEEHRKLAYYNKTLDAERHRVCSRFSSAGWAGVRVCPRRGRRRLAMARHLPHGPLILLVDGSRLVCSLCGHNSIRVHFRSCLGGGYRGHYIVVIGYRVRRGGGAGGSGGGLCLWLYRDPARRAPLCAAPPRALYAAANAPGTDNDAIFVYKSFR